MLTCVLSSNQFTSSFNIRIRKHRLHINFTSLSSSWIPLNIILLKRAFNSIFCILFYIFIYLRSISHYVSGYYVHFFIGLFFIMSFHNCLMSGATVFLNLPLSFNTISSTFLIYKIVSVAVTHFQFHQLVSVRHRTIPLYTSVYTFLRVSASQSLCFCHSSKQFSVSICLLCLLYFIQYIYFVIYLLYFLCLFFFSKLFHHDIKQFMISSVVPFHFATIVFISN